MTKNLSDSETDCYACVDKKEIKTLIRQTIKDERDQAVEEMLKEVEKLIVDEILICHNENTPTSRLTSLINKLKAKYEKN